MTVTRRSRLAVESIEERLLPSAAWAGGVPAPPTQHRWPPTITIIIFYTVSTNAPSRAAGGGEQLLNETAATPVTPPERTPPETPPLRDRSAVPTLSPAPPPPAVAPPTVIRSARADGPRITPPELPPSEPELPDVELPPTPEPQPVTPVEVGQALLSGVLRAGVPVFGELPLDARAVEDAARALLDRLARLGADADELSTNPEYYFWLTATACLVGGAGAAARVHLSKAAARRPALRADSVWTERGGARDPVPG